MCKKIAYTQKQYQYADIAYVRISFFSLPTFLGNFLNKKKEVWSRFLPFGDFVEKPLTMLEQQMVDIDSIANNLDIAIEEIISKKVFTFSNVQIDDYVTNIFLSRYFIFFEINLEGKELKSSIYTKIYEMFSLDGFDDVSLKAVEFGLSHKVKLVKENLWSILDPMAFKGVDEEVSTNGMYYDGYDVEGYFIETKRSLRQLKEVNSYLAMVLTWTKLNNWTMDAQESIWNLLKQESTRCFAK